MCAKVLGFVGAAVLLLAAVALMVHQMRPRVHVGALTTGDRVPLEQVDHAPFDALLQKYVDGEGLVAYRRWKESPEDLRALDGYLSGLSGVDLNAPSTAMPRLAFWINAYNALTLKGILLKYPVGSIKDIVSYTPGGYNVWRDLLLHVDGGNYSLDNIEHDLLRKLGEPRIHFALVCAARGCPPLRGRAYTAEHLGDELVDNARRFFVRPSNFRADAREKTVHLSQLLQWYGTDFAPTPLEQVQRLRPYFPSAGQAAWLDGPDLEIEYDLVYNWALNDQKPE
jgi:hypothetical protein